MCQLIDETATRLHPSCMGNSRVWRGIFAVLLSCLVQCARYDAQPSYLGLTLLLGRSSEPAAGTTATRTGYRIFLSATTVDGNIGGISGADSICNSDANRPSTQWTYTAFLVDGTKRRACTAANCPGGTAEHIDWILYANQPYYRSDGTTSLFTSNADGIFIFGNFANAMTGIASSYYTGFSSAGDWTSSGSNCTSWTSNNAVRLGRTGTGTFTNYGSLRDASNTNCSTVLRLLCVEQ